MALVVSGKKSSVSSSTAEDDDLIRRSSKKIKNSSSVSSKDEWPCLGGHGKDKTIAGMSFVDKLKGTENSLKAGDSDVNDSIMSDDPISDSESDKADEEPLCQIEEDPSRNFPSFSFSKKMKKKLAQAWENAVIVKLWGRSIGYKILLTILQPMWAKKGVISLINIGHGFFVVKFTNKEDCLNALTGGPWLIFDHYLTVRQWEPLFHPERAKIDKASVWVRVPNIPLEYYNREVLTRIGDRIGETIKIDIHTASHLRGHYARICVTVDLTKQLMSGFSLDGENYYLEYEGLHYYLEYEGLHSLPTYATKKSNSYKSLPGPSNICIRVRKSECLIR